MEIALLILEIISLLAIILGAAFLKSFLPGYLNRKGENLATKEDVADITDRIESVKKQHTVEIEAAKSTLLKEAHADNLKFEKEFEILTEIWEKLVDLRDTALNLRPGLDYEDTNNLDVRARRLDDFYQAFEKFRKAAMYRIPFYSKDIFDKIQIIMNMARKESREYLRGEKDDDKGQYWDNAEQFSEKFLIIIEELEGLIRSRISFK